MSATRPPRKWTAERIAMLCAEYAACTDDMALLDRLNALPGPTIASKSGMQMAAFDHGLSKTREALAEIQRRNGMASRGRKTSARRTPAREALIRAEYSTATDPLAFLAKINALPGPPLASPNAMRQWVFVLGVRKEPRTIAEVKARAARQNIKLALATPRSYAKKEPTPKPKRERAPEPYTVTAPEMRKSRIPPPEQFTAPVGAPGWAHRINREIAVHRPEDLTPEQEAALADAALERRLARARDMIARKMDGKPPAKAMAAFEDSMQGIIANTRLPAAVVRRLAGEVRMEVGS